MNPVYIDLHIHTSENADELEKKYKHEKLIEGIEAISLGYPVLISLTDHNTINKGAYLEIKTKYPQINLLIGVELHIKKHESANPYHCHVIFEETISEENIDKLNEILNQLYPKKMVSKEDEIPNIEIISNKFDEFEYIMLPHGGQSHNTFNKAIDKGTNLDTTLERSLYSNQFDGFTSRSNKGVEDTEAYFKKLGINEFVSLVTCTDNYTPEKYPDTKVNTKNEFVPTWMYAEPTFAGLRLSLSESTRLYYGEEPIENYCEHIEKVVLKNGKADIEVELKKGLNVVIGGSSSGKSLFVDMVYRKLIDSYEENNYEKFSIENASLKYKANMVPHYINQNFIIKILQEEDKDIGDIEIIRNLFPEDKEEKERIRKDIKEFSDLVQKLCESVQQVEINSKELQKIPILPRLLITKELEKTALGNLKIDEKQYGLLKITDIKEKEYRNELNEIQEFFAQNPLLESCSQEFEKIKKELVKATKISKKNDLLKELIDRHITNEEKRVSEGNEENAEKAKERDRLKKAINGYLKSYSEFKAYLKKISEFNVKYETKSLLVNDHTLSIENQFKLSNDTFINAINELMKKDHRIGSIKDLTPENLLKENFSVRPKVKGYDDFADRISKKVEAQNKRLYKIVTSDGKKFEDLSPGWKSAIILDLALGYEKDRAPIIIDQPEDNLATDYINSKLISMLKEAKTRKQIILVSHNATIPILGDAQNVVVCENIDGKIIIRSASLEGEINRKRTLDYVAEITDGGKPAIKKRVKKYNIKRFREES